MDKKFYTPAQAGKLFGVSGHTIWRWCREGKISYCKTFGGRFKISQQEVENTFEKFKRYGEKK